MSDDHDPRIVADEETRKTEALTLDTHLAEWRRIADRVSVQMVPAIPKIAKVAEQLVEPMLETQKAFRAAFEQIAASGRRWSETLNSIDRARFEFPKFDVPKFDLPDLSHLTENLEKFRISFQEIATPAFEAIQKSLRDLPPQTREAVMLLATHGWYFDLGMSFPQLWQLKDSLSNGNVSEAEAALIEYFEGESEDIGNSIAEVFPKRSHLLRAAFAAHRRQEYELSIPVFLAQADGMCKDATDKYLFIRKDKRPEIALYVEQIVADRFRASLLSPLGEILPISAPASERAVGMSALNRHAVLHGESLDYGTKTNSLKAISLVNYLAQIFREEMGRSRQRDEAEPSE